MELHLGSAGRRAFPYGNFSYCYAWLNEGTKPIRKTKGAFRRLEFKEMVASWGQR